MCAASAARSTGELVSTRIVGPAVSWFDARYRFRALTTYLGKFQPTSWEPRYVALKPVIPTPGLLRAVRTLL